METDLQCLVALRALEQRAQARPCTLAELLRLQQELESQLATFRRQREVHRATTTIAAETAELRMAVHSARMAIQNSLTAHALAQNEINRLSALVGRGHVQVVALLRLQGLVGGEFSDLNMDFVDDAVVREQAREQRLLVAVLTATGVLLGIACLVEIWGRSAGK
ncbi:MAG: hypothetical protein KIT22_10600 [Verrucomicrobiae bacterium]|nr:hypothetical protein [Verrucomicrobiae bacterium]